MRWRVEVIAGPGCGAAVPLRLGGRVVVGSGPSAGLVVQDPAVAPEHCAIELGLAGCAIEDLTRAGSVLVDGAPVRPGKRTRVLEYAVVRVGQACVAVGPEGAFLPGGAGAPGAAAARDEPPPSDDATRVDAPTPWATGGQAPPPGGPAPAPAARGAGAQHPDAPAVPGVVLVARLGAGASGEVWRGHLTPGGAPVAVKVLAADADAVTRARFEREAGLAARLEHPGLARILDLRRAACGRPALVRELVEGPTLAERLEAGPLAPRAVARAGEALALALAHAHARGVVHRDVKPQNVVLEPTRGPVLIDFDLALATASRATRARTRLTAEGDGLGSLGYIAPEQLEGARDVDGRADVCALGLTLYHALTGVAPFAHVDPEDFFEAVLARGPRPLAALAPHAPAGLVATLEVAYARRPADRLEARLLAHAFALLDDWAGGATRVDDPRGP